MYNYSIMPLDAAHVDEICEDIRRQYQQGITSCALFCMTLVPEGDPPIPKAEIFNVMEQINKLTVPAPTTIGQVLIENVCGLGSNVIVTKNVAKK